MDDVVVGIWYGRGGATLRRFAAETVKEPLVPLPLVVPVLVCDGRCHGLRLCCYIAMASSKEGSLMSDDQLARVRHLCAALPETTERLSHGEPTFFVGKRVFVMFAANHHNDGRSAVWLPVPPGFQDGLIDTAPQIFFKPPYVGHRGWVGIQLDHVSDAELQRYIHLAWELTAPAFDSRLRPVSRHARNGVGFRSSSARATAPPTRPALPRSLPDWSAHR